ncbi:MAG: 3-phosphoglycerate dehydrogenase [Bacteroidota bacterium]|nr:3-phosphoglycerate dehydrogenase [Bacteroidota bacterium]
MKKVLVATDKPFVKVAVDGIRKIVEDAGYELALLEKYKEHSDLVNAVATADAVIIRSDIVDKEVLEAGKSLKIVVRAGAGYDNIDLEAATANNVVAMNTPGQNANAVAELAFGMMVYLARNTFNGTSGTELRGKSIGIHAYGNVGKYVALIAKGFGMDVYAFDPFVPEDVIVKDGITPVKSVDELYSKCQYVSLHIPATKETKGSINFDLLSKMPKGATLVNTARKEVIDEASLVKVFEARPDFRYVSDVAPDNAAELAEKFAGRIFCTPKKMGAQTEEANINAGLAAARQIVDFFQTGNTKFKVNK